MAHMKPYEYRRREEMHPLEVLEEKLRTGNGAAVVLSVRDAQRLVEWGRRNEGREADLKRLHEAMDAATGYLHGR